jgi:hypothetical protein
MFLAAQPCNCLPSDYVNAVVIQSSRSNLGPGGDTGLRGHGLTLATRFNNPTEDISNCLHGKLLECMFVY